MDKANIWLIILGMAVVTYIPRALPAALMDKMRFGPRASKFLRLIPYTAMAALIFPGIMTVDANPFVGVAGGVAAGLLAWKRCPVMVCVLAAIAVTFLLVL